MTAFDFIKENIGQLAMLFTNIEIKYAFDAEINTHIIQLDPVEEYYSNQELDKAWIPIAIRFEESFADYITFISSDSPLRIEHPQMEWNAIVHTGFILNDYNTIIEKLMSPAQVELALPDGNIYWSKASNKVQINAFERAKSDITLTDFHTIESNNHKEILVQQEPFAYFLAAGDSSFAMAA